MCIVCVRVCVMCVVCVCGTDLLGLTDCWRGETMDVDGRVVGVFNK